MAVIFRRILHTPLPSVTSSSSSSLPCSIPLRSPKFRITASSLSSSSPSMDDPSRAPRNFREFPYVSAPHKNLMVDLLSLVETRLESQLRPCTLPPDVQFFRSSSGSAQGSLYIRSGLESSQIDFILGSWIHCKMPTGGALNITSLSAFLNASTDAPNFLIELIQSSPTSFILILDLPPRKDLVLYPEYLKSFYEDTQLDSLRQTLEKLPEVRPYFSSALYIRCVTSPTAIMIRVDTEGAGAVRLEEILKDHVDHIAKEAMGIWLHRCAGGQRSVEEAEKFYLEKRDGMIKSKTIEIDLGSSFPRLFGPDIANRVLGVIREVYEC